MNKTAIALLCALALPAWADDAHHPESAPAATAPAPQSQAGTVKQLRANVKQLQTQLGQLSKAGSDAQRQALLAEYLRTLHENMALAESLGGEGMECPMMEGGMAQPMGHDLHQGMNHGMGQGTMPMMGGGDPGQASMAERMQRLEKRMDMMQMMMERMGGTPAK